jgi:hypothetical protein
MEDLYEREREREAYQWWKAFFCMLSEHRESAMGAGI